MTKEFDYSPIDKILENHEKTAVIAISVSYTHLTLPTNSPV